VHIHSLSIKFLLAGRQLNAHSGADSLPQDAALTTVPGQNGISSELRNDWTEPNVNLQGFIYVNLEPMKLQFLADRHWFSAGVRRQIPYFSAICHVSDRPQRALKVDSQCLRGRRLLWRGRSITIGHPLNVIVLSSRCLRVGMPGSRLFGDGAPLRFSRTAPRETEIVGPCGLLPKSMSC
jgi:hypothetical protein